MMPVEHVDTCVVADDDEEAEDDDIDIAIAM